MSLEESNIEVIASNFIEKEIEKDLKDGKCVDRVNTRFPPEPNGYLHIGSAYAINISYSAAKKYGGKFNLRFDDTNPTKEDIEYVEAIKDDMRWMGFDYGEKEFYGSDYFYQIYQYAINLIKKGMAYVDDLNADEIKNYRGTLTEGGKESPYRNRTIEENLGLFEVMKKGEFPTGSKVLRAKIDMSSPNMNMRDPVIYRIQHVSHYRSGGEWCIYPMYDYAHPLQDKLEGITHSLCSAEFKDHRPLYEWVLEELDIKNPPKQREFGRMNLSGVVTSKRYLRELVTGGFVDGWDDPRMCTLKGMKRRGFTPEAIKSFLGEIGVSKAGSVVDVAMLQNCLREDLKPKVPSVMAVINPLKIIIRNYDMDEEMLQIVNNPVNPELGSRKVPFSREIYIEQEDFMENPSSKFHRLTLGKEVRLKGAYIIKCEQVIKDDVTGCIKELICTYDPDTKSGTGSTRKVKGTIHWVSKRHCQKVQVRLYDDLMLDEPKENSNIKDWKERLNPKSLIILDNCYVEPFLIEAERESKYQFMRLGYFCADNRYSTKDKKVFNRIVELKDTKKNKK